MTSTSRVEYTNQNGNGPFSYGGVDLFQDTLVPHRSQLQVFINKVLQNYASSSPGAGEYVLDIENKTVTLGSVLVATDTLLITRSTSKTPYVDFTNNSPLTAADLDIVSKQGLFAAEESTAKIEAGEVQQSLPQLTDVDPGMTPGEGEFLRYNSSTSQWESQEFTPEGVGPDVNIVTDFPSNAQAGDLIYHTVFGATYIYQGGEWSFICGTGDTASAAAGTTIANLTFSGDARLDQVTLPAGWHCFIPSENLQQSNSNTGTFTAFTSAVSSNNDWVDITDSTQIAAAETAGKRFDKLWFTSSLDVDGTTGELIIDNAVYRTEAQQASGHQEIAGDGTSGSANTWWGGINESNDAIDAPAVLMPRLISPAAADIAVGGGITTSGLYNTYRNLLWSYPAGINWGSQSWRITTKLVALQTAFNSGNNDLGGGIFWMPKNYPHLAKDVNGWTIGQAVDTGGLVAASNNDIGDARHVFQPGLYISLAGTGSSSNAGSYIIPYVGIKAFEQNGYLTPILPGSSPQPYHPALPNNQRTGSGQLGVSSTQSANNGTLSDKCIAYTIVTEWNATAKVMTVTTTADSNDTFRIVNGDSNPASVSTKTVAGDAVKAWLDSMSTDFWFNHGANGGYYNTTTSNFNHALTSIKIETL